MATFQRGDLTFDVLDSGPADGPVVVLLHGFPQWNVCWAGITERLTAAGYRCLAPNQRGYSPAARPRGRRAYRMAELVADIEALLDSHDLDTVHLVGHDWGAAVAWTYAARHPEHVTSLTALSVPHPSGFMRSVLTTTQFFSSLYMVVFQLPWLPERLLEKTLATQLPAIGLPQSATADAVRRMAEPGARSATLNWYRGMPFGIRDLSTGKVAVPTLFVWSDRDIAIRRRTAESCRAWVTGPFRFETLHGISHWIPDQAADATATMILEHIAA